MRASGEYEAPPKYFLAVYQQASPANTGLFEAARRGDAEKCAALLKDGACMNWYNEEVGGWTPIHCAVESGDLDTVRTLVEFEDADEALLFHANISSTALKEAPIHVAAEKYKGDLALLKYLIEKGANVEATNCYGNTALMLACVSNHMDVVKFLLEVCGANPNAMNEPNKETALHMAIAGATAKARTEEKDFIDLRIIMILLKHGVDVNSIDVNGSTPLHLVVSITQSESLVDLGQLLVQNGANPKLRDNDGRKPTEILSLRNATGDLFNLLKQHEFFIQ